MFVTGGSPTNFNYPTYDQASGLFVAASLYDVTSGSPVLISSPIAMTDESNGVYFGAFTPALGHSYLVVMGVYTDGTYTTVDTSRAPAAEQYDAFISDTSLMNFNYGAYDQNASLTLQAEVFDVTDSTSALVNMTYVALGVYFGQYLGTLGKQYLVVKSPTDLSRPPGADSFQCFSFGSAIVINNLFVEATLIGQPNTGLFGSNSMIQFTQGDTAVLQLIATDGDGNPVNLTGASFTTQIKGPNGVIATFLNSQHTANPDQIAHTGQFTLSLSADDTMSCGAGENKDIITKIVQGSNTVYFHGNNVLNVDVAIPLQ